MTPQEEEPLRLRENKPERLSQLDDANLCRSMQFISRTGPGDDALTILLVGELSLQAL
jgi:hypothetical protein